MPFTPQDSQAIGNMGGSMNHVVMQLAQMKYHEAMRQQQMAIQLGHLALQKQLGEAQIGHLNAQTATEGNRQDEIGAQANMERAHTKQLGAQEGLYNVQTAKQQAIIDAAEGARAGAVGGNPINQMQGPTAVGGEQLRRGNLLGDVIKSVLLSGRGASMLTPHTTPANAVSSDYFGNQTFGPRNTAPGYQYQAKPGEPNYNNPRPLNSGNDLPAMLKFITDAGKPNADYEDPSQQFPLRNSPLYTNIVDLATAATSAMKGTNAPTSSQPQAPASADSPTFDSEADARAAGQKSGAIIRLRGVGKVQLK